MIRIHRLPSWLAPIRAPTTMPGTLCTVIISRDSQLLSGGLCATRYWRRATNEPSLVVAKIIFSRSGSRVPNGCGGRAMTKTCLNATTFRWCQKTVASGERRADEARAF